MATLSLTPEARTWLQAAVNGAKVSEPVINLVLVGRVVTPTPEELERAREGESRVLRELYARGDVFPKTLSPAVRDRSDFPGQTTIDVEGLHFLLPSAVARSSLRLILRVANDRLELARADSE